MRMRCSWALSMRCRFGKRLRAVVTTLLQSWAAASMTRVGMDLPSDICLAAPGRAVSSLNSGESLTQTPVRVPRPLRIGGIRAGGAAAGGRFFSRSDIDLVGSDTRLVQTWLAATAGGGFSASAFDISAESERAVDPPKFKPQKTLEQLRTQSRVPRTSPHAAPEPKPKPKPRTAAGRQANGMTKRGRQKKAQAAGAEAARAPRPYALTVASERPRLANVSPQRRPTSAAHRPTSAAPRPVLKGRVPWMSLIGVEGDRPSMYETHPSRATGPTLTSAPRRKPRSGRGSSARRRGRPSTAAAGGPRSRSPLQRAMEPLDPASSLTTRPSTAPSGGGGRRSPTPSRSPSPTDRNRTQREADLSYSRALAATAGDVMVASGAVGADYVGEVTGASPLPRR
jgi:hypothetical protein